jgi:hypothetical protein
VEAHDVISLLSALAVLIGAVTGFLLVYYHHPRGDEDREVGED